MNHRWKAGLRNRGKDAFVMSLPYTARLLDVGCGNDSPRRVKNLRTDIWYMGLDVQDYEQSDISKSIADEYRVTTSENFLATIRAQTGTMDAVLSSHNLEHCDSRHDVVVAMCHALKPGGALYLAYPSEATLNMPSRIGTLNYHDDNSHVGFPPQWREIKKTLQENDLLIEFECERYRPLLPVLLGLLLEPWSSWSKRVGPLGSTWALYGFESVIWARKLS